MVSIPEIASDPKFFSEVKNAAIIFSLLGPIGFITAFTQSNFAHHGLLWAWKKEGLDQR